MTANDAINALLRDRYRRSVVMPRYTPIGWWECDVFELTNDGYFREYEIKLSVADFKADAKKKNVVQWEGGKRLETPREDFKHEHLALKTPGGPVQFWFVTPENLLSAEMIPSFAGLIELRARENGRGAIQLFPVQRIKAPRLHNTKADPKIKPHVMSVGYWRLLHLMAAKPASISVSNQQPQPSNP